MKKIIFLLSLMTIFFSSCSFAPKTPVDEHTKTFDTENLKYKNVGDDFTWGYVYERQSGTTGIVGKWNVVVKDDSGGTIADFDYEFKKDGYMTFNEITYVGYFHRKGTGKYKLYSENDVVKVYIDTVSDKKYAESNTYILNVNSDQLKLTKVK